MEEIQTIELKNKIRRFKEEMQLVYERLTQIMETAKPEIMTVSGVIQPIKYKLTKHQADQLQELCNLFEKHIYPKYSDILQYNPLVKWNNYIVETDNFGN